MGCQQRGEHRYEAHRSKDVGAHDQIKFIITRCLGQGAVTGSEHPRIDNGQVESFAVELPSQSREVFEALDVQTQGLGTQIAQADAVGFGSAGRKNGPTRRDILTGEFKADATRSAQDQYSRHGFGHSQSLAGPDGGQCAVEACGLIQFNRTRDRFAAANAKPGHAPLTAGLAQRANQGCHDARA